MTLRTLLLGLILILASFRTVAEEPTNEATGNTTDNATDNAADNSADNATDQAAPAIERGDGIDRPKTMSGMSILGNEEAPKSLVIIPWKSSELGEDISLSDTLDDRARPVDRDVFLRELNFYLIRSGK